MMQQNTVEKGEIGPLLDAEPALSRPVEKAYGVLGQRCELYIRLVFFISILPFGQKVHTLYIELIWVIKILGEECDSFCVVESFPSGAAECICKATQYKNKYDNNSQTESHISILKTSFYLAVPWS